jgi:hypothetical protein
MAYPFQSTKPDELQLETTHNQSHAAIARATALVSAVGAGFGTWVGLQSPDDGALHGQLLPLVAGGVIGTVFAASWHIAISKSERVRKTLGKLTVATAGAVLVACTFGASSWAVATALCGDAARRQYNAEQIAEKRRAFEIASAELAAEAGIIPVVETAATELHAMAEAERDGRLSPRGPGSGPNANMLEAAGGGQQLLAHQMQDKYDAGPARWLEDADKTLDEMQASVAAAPKTFGQLIGKFEGIIARINGFTLTDMASKGGIMEVTVWSRGSGGQSVVEAISSGVDKVKQRVIDQAKSIEQARKEALNAPEAQVTPFRALEPREATLRYATGAAIGGFVTAAAIDIAPYVLMLMVLFTHDDPLLNRPKIPRARRPDESEFDSHTIEGPWPRAR